MVEFLVGASEEESFYKSRQRLVGGQPLVFVSVGEELLEVEVIAILEESAGGRFVEELLHIGV